MVLTCRGQEVGWGRWEELENNNNDNNRQTTEGVSLKGKEGRPRKYSQAEVSA